MHDVIVSGAGPAGSLAALCLARRGARVLLLDRARFPRPKLCGDTLNPGAMALLRTHGLGDVVAARGLPLDGMVVTSADGVVVEGRYGHGLTGLAVRREVLDMVLLEAALEAGVEFRDAARVVGPALGSGDQPRVRGVRVRGHNRRTHVLPARLTIAADGRRSPVALALGLARHPRWPRRWAVGAYFTGVTGAGGVGEMHVRPNGYLGVSPSPEGLTNICVVTADRGALAAPGGLLERAMRDDPLLRDRCQGARRATPVVSLGPLAVDVRAAGALRPTWPSTCWPAPSPTAPQRWPRGDAGRLPRSCGSTARSARSSAFPPACAPGRSGPASYPRCCST